MDEVLALHVSIFRGLRALYQHNTECKFKQQEKSSEMAVPIRRAPIHFSMRGKGYLISVMIFFLCCGLICADRAVLLLAGQKRSMHPCVCVCKARYMRRRLCFLGSTTCALD